MRNASSILCEYVLERAADEPLARRAKLYEAMAEVSASTAERQTLRALAVECLKIERRHRQLVLDFKRGSL